MRRLVVAVIVALAVGAVAGYLYGRNTKPTLEEKAEEAGRDLRRAWDKVTR
ncbi:MAG TPA: hypothetical protein VLS93_16845 [Anaeromyxobacteraceae bacterium]|nr:hypothetical protein [Anaeromyxobacteraceae bacterium]